MTTNELLVNNYLMIVSTGRSLQKKLTPSTLQPIFIN